MSYTGASLTGIESIDSIDAYADSGYYLRTDFANDYERVVLRDGEVTLTNRPEPVPAPTPTEYLEDEQGNKYEQVIVGGTLKLKLVESHDGTTNY